VSAIKAFGYLRVSTEEQATSALSLDAQAQRIRDTAKAEGWDLIEIFREEGVSGSREDRPELKKLLARLAEVDRVVITKLDRLSRDEAYSFDLYRLFEGNGVVLKSIEDNVDDSENGLLLRGLLTSLSAHEIRRGSKRTREALSQNAVQGKHHARWPLGYDKSGEPLEPAAGVVRRIFEQAANGVAQGVIASQLNDDRITTSTGKPWKQDQVKKVLNNVTYCGRVESKGVIYPGNHASIVSGELWERVAKIREANKRDRKGGASGRHPAGRHLFTKGLLRCAHCGEAMAPRTGKAGHEGESYRCYTRLSTKADACVQTNVPRALLDTAVFDFFASQRFDAQATQEYMEAKAGSAHKQRADLLAAAKREEHKAREILERMTRERMEDRIDPDEWRDEWKPRLDKEVAGASGKREQLERQVKESAAETEAIAQIAGSAAVQALAKVRAQIAGEVTSAKDIDSLRATLGLLFERFEIARTPLSQIVDSGEPELNVPLLAAGEWTVALHPRTEWIGDLDGYWREIAGRVPLLINNESLTTVSD
jgi:site-specific DNA recombinase